MRITLISAHYPPNFVSGGTLQPQRLARGLLARGHDVRVYAGCLDSTRRPLDSWTDRDDHGLPVEWVVTTPWIDWASHRNYDNPLITEHFTQSLATHPADVVHIHSLQGLGVGVAEAAAASGAATVVTMHDFWWVCARQFLVDRDHQPCCLVVAAGDCACEDGRTELDRRAARLREALRSVDLILAPSRSAAELLEANGVPAARLRVDENGMDVPTSPRPRPSPAHADGQPVVIRFTGGSNPMKGADVLLRAAEEIGAEPRLRIVAHGIEEAIERAGRSHDAPRLEAVPPYLPEQLDAVLDDTDILVLPSVMRESHSLVTREALLRGVPVVTTDTIGPEEVVIDGVNGRVVPAGDAHLLAEALRSASRPAELEALARGAATPPIIRTTEEQLDSLEAAFTDIRSAPKPTMAVGGIRRVLFLVGIDGAPLRYRAQLPAEALGLVGVHSELRHYRDPDVRAQLRLADIVVAYRVPATVQVLDLLEEARASGTPVAFDVDDLIFDPDLADEIPALRLLPEADARLWLDGVHRYRTTMESCDAFIGSTAGLVDHARAAVGIDTYRFDNGVGIAVGGLSDIALREPRIPGPLRVAYLSGTTTHDADWRYIEGAVIDVLETHPDIELWLGGHLQPSEALERLRGRVRRMPFMPWTELPALLRQTDLNLAPLEPGSRFNEAKSAIKWLEAALVLTPTIASPTEPFVEAIDDGRTGWLAGGPDEWAEAVDHALRHADQRTLVAARARRAALLGWSPHRQGARYLEILESIRAQAEAGKRRRPDSGWEVVAPDEPLLGHRTALEPYPPELRGSTRLRRKRRRRQPVWHVIAFKATRLRESLAEEGAGGVARGAGRVAARIVRRIAGRDDPTA